jgi:hypothetical protein
MHEQHVAVLYTGQQRAFDVRWQHQNHLAMLAGSPGTLFHSYKVSTFFVIPEDHWYTNATRHALLDLQTLKKIVTYEPYGSVMPAGHQEPLNSSHCTWRDRPLSLGFHWPPREHLSKLESRVKLFWRTNLPFTPTYLQGMQLHIAALTSFAAEREHSFRFDAFVRLRMDCFLFSPWRMPKPLGPHANVTLIAQDTRVQDWIFFGGRQVLEWVSRSMEYTACSTGGSPSGVVNIVNARAAGVERIIAGPGGGAIALLRINRHDRCVRISEAPDDLFVECRQGPCCNDRDLSPIKYLSYKITHVEGELAPFACSADCASCATACREPPWRSASIHGMANLTEWVEAGEPVVSWYAHIRCPATTCKACESDVAMEELRTALLHHGYHTNPISDMAPRHCPNENGVSIQPDGYMKAMDAQEAVLAQAKPGSEVGIQFRDLR